MTLFFASHEITIRRMRPFGAVKQSFSATFTAYSADIQPASGSRLEQSGGRLGTTYQAFVDATCPVKEGDQIDSGGVRYSVRSVIYFHGASLLDHKELILTSQNSA